MRWSFDHAHNEAKSYRRTQFFLFYGVQGENTIARRQKVKLISIDLDIFNSSPKFSELITFYTENVKFQLGISYILQFF